MRRLNSAEMKAENRSRVLSCVRAEPLSRADLARRTGLTRAAITGIVDGLIADGLIVEGARAEAPVGRSPILLEVRPQARFAAGLNISREGYVLGLVDLCGDVTVAQTYAADEFASPDEALDFLCEELKRLTAAHRGDRFLGVGITAPGPLDAAAGRILHPPNLAFWEDFPVADALADRWGCPVRLENNAKALALAEKDYGAGRALGSFLELVVDTGIGAGIVLDGTLFRGTSGFGSELGHCSVDLHGPLCSCGNRGCVELYAAIPNILRYAQTQGMCFSSWEALVDAAEGGDASARGVVEQEAAYLACAATNAVNLFDLAGVVLAGTVTYRHALLAELLEQRMGGIMRHVRPIQVCASALTGDAAVLSSANLVLADFFGNKR